MKKLSILVVVSMLLMAFHCSNEIRQTDCGCEGND